MNKTYALLRVPLHDGEGAFILDVLHNEPVHDLH